MTYIYIDESGDLGFKPTSSKWFLFTIVLTNNHRRIEKIVKRVRKDLKDSFSKRGTSKVVIKIKPSHTEKCLQAVDFISWAIFRKYERGDYEYYEIIKNRIIEENLLFP